MYFVTYPYPDNDIINPGAGSFESEESAYEYIDQYETRKGIQTGCDGGYGVGSCMSVVCRDQ